MADDDQQRRVEIEIAVRDSMSTFLKTASQALESFNRELIKTGSAGQTSLEEVRKRFQSLDEQGKKTSGVFGGLNNVFGGISKSLLSPIGLVAVLETMRRSMDVFAVGALQLSNFSKNIGVSVADINRAAQQAARAGIEPEKASANLAKMASTVKELYTNPVSPNLEQLRRMNPVLAENVIKLEGQGKTMQAIQLVQQSYMRAAGPDAEKYRITLRDMFGGEASWWETTKDNLEGVPALWEANTEAALRYHKVQVDIATHWTNAKNQIFTGLLAGDIVQPSQPELPTTGKPQGRFFTGQGGVVAPGGAFEMFGSEMPKQPESYPSRLKRLLRSGMEGAGKLFDMSAGAAELEGGATLGGDGMSGAKPMSFTEQSLKIEEDTNQSLHEIRDVLTRMEERGTLTLSAKQTAGVGGTGGVGGASPMGALPGFPRSGGPPQPVGAPAPAVPFAQPILPGGGIPRGIPSALEPSAAFGERFGGFAPVGAGRGGIFPQLGATKGFPGAAVSGAPIPGATGEYGSPITGIVGQGLGAPRAAYGGLRAHAHAGTDISAAEGTAVKAESSGVIEKEPNFQPGATGGIVTVKYDDGTQAKYMHLSKWDLLKQGDRVTRGQVIGLSGFSPAARSSGAHLHVEYRDAGGRLIDPAARYGGGRQTFAGISGSFPKGTTQEQAAAQRGGAPATAALAPWPSGPTASPISTATGQTEFLQQHRANLMKELRDDPEKMKRLMGLAQAEVGNDPAGQRAFVETTLDRWAARQQTVDQGIKDAYFGRNPRYREPSAQTQKQFPGIISGAEAGSALFPGATGNASDAPGNPVLSRHRARGELAGMAGGEGFINEQVKADIEFRKKLFGAGSAKPPSLVQQRFGEFWNKDEASSEENEAKSRAMINGSLTRGGRDAAKSAEVNGKVTFDNKSAFEGGKTEPFIELNLGRTSQAGQAGSVNTVANRFSFE